MKHGTPDVHVDACALFTGKGLCLSSLAVCKEPGIKLCEIKNALVVVILFLVGVLCSLVIHA